MSHFPPRAHGPEKIDSFEYSEADFARTFADLRLINRYLGGVFIARKALAPLLSGVSAATILDIGTGGADLPLALRDWGRSRRVELDFVGLDPNPKALRIAARESNLRLVRGDAAHLPIATGAFDFAISSLTLHHFDDELAVAALREMRRIARLGIVVLDLRRGVLPAALIWLVTRATGMHPLTRHDAPLSVLRARTPDEYRELAHRAGLKGARVESGPYWRVSLVWRRKETD